MAVTQKRKDEIRKRRRKKSSQSVISNQKKGLDVSKINPGGETNNGRLTRDQKIAQMGDLRKSAAASGVNLANNGSKVVRDRLASGVQGRRLETDQDRRNNSLSTRHSTTQSSLAIQNEIRDNTRDIDRRRTDQVALNRNQQARALAEQRGLSANAVGIDANGRVVADLNNFIGNAQGSFKVVGNKQQFMYDGLSDNPEVAELQKNYIDAKRANSKSAMAAASQAINDFVGGDDLSGVGLSAEDEAKFRQEQGTAELLASRAVSSSAGSQEATLQLKATLDGINSQRQQLDDEMNTEKARINAEFEKQKLADLRLAEGSITVGNERVQKELMKRAKSKIESDFVKNRDSAFADLDIQYKSNISVLDTQAEQANQKFLSFKEKPLTAEQIAKSERDNWIAEQQAADPSLSTKYLINKYNDLNKFDASGEENKAIREATEAILEGQEDDPTKFSQLVGQAGDVDKAYKGIKALRGEFVAKKMRQEFYEAKGWDETTINTASYTQEFKDLYNGEESSALALAAFVENGKKYDLDDSYIATSLRKLKDNKGLDQELIDNYIQELDPVKEVKRDIRTFGDELVEITDDGVEVLRTKKGKVKTASTRSSKSSTATALGIQSTIKDVQSGNFTKVEGINIRTADYKNEDHVKTLLSSIDPGVVENARLVLDPISGVTQGSVYAGVKEKPKERELNKAITILRKQMKALDPEGADILLSAGGKTPVASERERLQTAIEAADQLNSLQGVFDKRKGKKFIQNVIAGNNPFDQDGRDINSKLQGLLPKVARGLFGEVGVLTDTDIARYKKTLPTLNDTEDVRNVLMSSMYNIASRNLEITLNSLADSKIDVSRYHDDLVKLRSNADRFDALIPDASDAPSTTEESPVVQTTSTQSIDVPGFRTFSAQEIQSLGLSNDELGGFQQAAQEMPDVLAEFMKEGYTVQETLNALQ